MATSPLTTSIAVQDDGVATTFSSGAVELARYEYRPDTVQLESPKPYLHPLQTLGGQLVSLYRPHDHVWHKGIAWSLANAGAHNFWGGPTYTRSANWYEQLPNNGSQDHVESVTAESKDGSAEFAHDLVWHAESGEDVFRERRELSAQVLDDTAWVLTWSSSMTNVSGATIELGSPTTEGRENAGYGGLFWRGPRSFDDGTVIAPTGVADAEELRATRHDWMAFVGKHDGDGGESTVLMVDSGENPGGQPQWFVRSGIYACLGPAPFFSEVIPIADGETLTFRYAVVVADGGSDLDRAAALAASGRAALRGDSE